MPAPPSPAPPPADRTRRIRAWLPVLAALAIVGFAWRHQLGFWFTDTDTLADVVVARVSSPGDLLGQLNQPLTGGYGGLNANFYRPLTMLHFALQRALFGWDPAGWHAWDLGLHLAVLGVFAALVRRLGASITEATVLVLAAGLHPVSAEIVPAIARNIDLLLGLLTGLALLAAARGRAGWASALGLLALTSKEPAIMVLPVIAGLGGVLHGRRALATIVGPWLIGVPAFLAMRSHVLSGVGGYEPGQLLHPGGLLHVVRAAGLDTLATPWALELRQLVGPGAGVRYLAGGVAMLGIFGLAGALRRHGPRIATGLALWGLPMVLMGLTATYTRRLLYVSTLGFCMLLAAALVRGPRMARIGAVAIVLALLPGTPVWRPYLDWGVGAEVSRGSSVAVEAQLHGLPAGTTLWLVDRPLRHNLDGRRTKFWQGRMTLNHGMGRYSLQAWLDERFGPGHFDARSLTSVNATAPLGPAQVHVQDGTIHVSRGDLPRIVNKTAQTHGWQVDTSATGSALTPPDGARGAVLVYGAPGAVVRLGPE